MRAVAVPSSPPPIQVVPDDGDEDKHCASTRPRSSRNAANESSGAATIGRIAAELARARPPHLRQDRGHLQGPRHQTLYCASGQAENLIKLHKAQLASDRTSCRSPLANQMRLILHTAAYWLIHRPRRHPQSPPARHRRVRHHPPAAVETRHAGYRIGVTCSARLCRCLPRRRFDPPRRSVADASGAVSDGAAIAPSKPSTIKYISRRNRRLDTSRAHPASAPNPFAAITALNKRGESSRPASAQAKNPPSPGLSPRLPLNQVSYYF